MKQLNSGFLLEQLIDDITACKDVAQARRLLSELINFTPNLERAIECCVISHAGQFRKSGEPYAIHPILVACIVAHMGGDEDMIIAALLHDVVEDTDRSIESVREDFGEEVAKLVEGLTKIVAIREDKLASSESNERLAASAMTFRKMLLISTNLHRGRESARGKALR